MVFFNIQLLVYIISITLKCNLVCLKLNLLQFCKISLLKLVEAGNEKFWQGLRRLWTISKFQFAPPKCLQVLEPLKTLTWSISLEFQVELGASFSFAVLRSECGCLSEWIWKIRFSFKITFFLYYLFSEFILDICI